MSIEHLIASFDADDELRYLRLRVQTLEADRDAEKAMKATARMQRDKMTKRANDAIALLKSINGLHDHPKWLEIQAFIEGINARN